MKKLLAIIICTFALFAVFLLSASARVLTDSELEKTSFMPVGIVNHKMDVLNIFPGTYEYPAFLVSEDGQNVFEMPSTAYENIIDTAPKTVQLTKNGTVANRIYSTSDVKAYYDSSGNKKSNSSVYTDELNRGYNLKVIETELDQNCRHSFVVDASANESAEGDDSNVVLYMDVKRKSGKVRYYIDVDSSNGYSIKLVQNEVEFSYELDANDKSKIYIYKKVSGKNRYLGFYKDDDGNTLCGFTTKKTAILVYADLMHRYTLSDCSYATITCASFQNGDNLNDTSTLTHYVVENTKYHDTKFTMPESINTASSAYKNVYKWANTKTKANIPDSAIYSAEFKDFTVEPTVDDGYWDYAEQKEQARDYYDVIDNCEHSDINTDIKYYSVGSSLSYRYYAQHIFYPTYYKNGLFTLEYNAYEKIGVLDARIGGTTCYGKKIESGQKVFESNWVVISVPSANSCGYTYSMFDIQFYSGDDYLSYFEYTKGKLSSGAEYIKFKMPERPLQIRIDLSKKAAPMDNSPRLNSYIVLERKEDDAQYSSSHYAYYNTELTAKEKSRISFYTGTGTAPQPDGTVIIGEDETIVNLLVYWDEFLEYKKSEGYAPDVDKNTYTFVSSYWYRSYNKDRNYTMLCRDDNLNATSDFDMDFQGEWFTLPEVTTTTAVYYKNVYTYRRESTGTVFDRTVVYKVNVEPIKDVEIYGYGYSENADSSHSYSMETNSLYVVSNYTKKWEYSTDNGKTWTDIPLTNFIDGSVWLDMITTDPKISTGSGGIVISFARIQRRQANTDGFYKFTVTEPGKYLFRIKNDEGDIITKELDFPGLHKHVWSDWIYSADYHYKRCTVKGCKSVQKGQEHTLNDNGECTLCFYPVTVSYQRNGGDWAKDFTPITSIQSNEALKLPTEADIIKTGYKFCGWEISEQTGPTVTYSVKWKFIYNITYDLNGGDWAKDDYVPVSVYLEGDNLALPTSDDILKDGYKFGGWELIESVGAAKKYRAKWHKIYTVAYELDGGEWVDGYKPSEVYIEGDKIVYPEVNKLKTRELFEHIGWFRTVNEDEATITWQAEWIGIYYIYFDLDDGKWPTGNLPQEKYRVDEKVEVFEFPDEWTPQRKGYVFKEWHLIEDDNGHYKKYLASWECEHTGGTATCREKALCTKCGERYGELNSENHTGSKQWYYTETDHSYLWSCCGASVFDREHGLFNRTHLFEYNSCYICGYKKSTHEHVAGDDWTSDNTGHWKTCKTCNAKIESTFEAHTRQPEEAHCDYGVNCRDCGYVIEAKRGHSFTLIDKDNYASLKVPAGCMRDAVYYYICDKCGEISKTKIYVDVGSKIGYHTYELEYANPETLVSKATCTSEGVYYKTCRCGLISDTLTFTTPKIAHKYNTLKYSYSTHWYECDCGAVNNEVMHVYDNDADNTCSKCPYDRTNDRPVITTTELPAGKVGVAYDATVKTVSHDDPLLIQKVGCSGNYPEGLKSITRRGRIKGTPTKAGTYTFTVKVTNAAGAAARTFTIVIKEAGPEEIKVTYALGNGNWISGYEPPSSYMSDKTLELPTADKLTNVGYTFDGWELTANTATAKTYTAKWKANSYTLTFILGNGQDDVKITQDYGTVLTAPVPTREGYFFAGWNSSVPSTIPAENATYTARWQINKYTLRFVLGNGESDVIITQDYGTKVSIADPTREGYSFAGWDNTVPSTMPASDLSYTAKWEPNKYTLTFVLGNGEDDVVITEDYGTALSAPVPTKDYCTFDGWDKSVPTSVPAENATYTAKWKGNTYAVKYELNGGTNADGNPENYTYGTGVSELLTPTRENYTFMEWTLDGKAAAGISATQHDDITLVANWKLSQSAPSVVPEIESLTDDSITIKPVEGNENGAKPEYSIDGGKTWQEDNVFTDLDPDTEYTVAIRYGETDTYAPSSVGESTVITTDSDDSSSGGVRMFYWLKWLLEFMNKLMAKMFDILGWAY